MKPQPPCKDCHERRQFCHADCDKWATYEKERNDYYAFLKSQRDDANIFLIEQSVKRSREYRRKNKK